MTRRALEGRLVWALLAAAAVVLLVALAGGAAGDPADDPSPGRPDVLDPRILSQVRAHDEREGKRKRGRDSAAAKADRKRSRSAFKGQSRQEALATAKRKFARLMDEPLWRGPDLAPGERVKRHVGTDGLIIEDAGDKLAYVQSQTPLATVGPGGQVEPIDLSLVPDGKSLRTANAAAPTEFGPDAQAAVRLERSNVRIGFEGAASSVRQSAGDKVHWANVDTDTDFFAGPLPNGVETFTVLRSEDAPERTSLVFDLPAGARLEAAPATSGQAARVVRDDKELADVGKPAAVDAEGEPVPVEYSVRGNRLELHVDHRSGDYAMPILVDPSVTERWQYGSLGQPDQSGWRRAACAASRGCLAPTLQGGDVSAYGWNMHTTPWWGYHGLYTFTDQGLSYNHGDFGEWFWKAYGNSTIFRVDYNRLLHYPSGPGNACMLFGLTDAGGSWIGTPVTDCNWYGGDYGVGGTHSQTICTGSPPCAPNQNYPGNNAMYIEALYDYNGQRTNGVATTMSEVSIAMRDFYAPVVESYSSTFPTAWTKQASGSVSLQARDDGLGMKQLAAWIPNTTGAGGGFDQYLHKAPYPCNDDVGGVIQRDAPADRTQSPCGNRLSKTFGPFSTDSMPEGVRPIDVGAYDLLHNFTGGPQAQIKVDRTAPAYDPHSGSLNQRSGWITDPSPSLTVNVRDPSPNGGQVSGVKYSKIEYDPPSGPFDQRNNDKADGSPGPCDAASGCKPALSSHTLGWSTAPDGTHTVRVSTDDAVGHPVSETWTVKLDRQLPTFVVDPTGSLYAPGGWIGGGTKSVQVQTADTTSGVKKVELLVSRAGQTPAVVDTEAPQTCCPNTFSPTLDWTPAAGDGDGTYDVKVRVYDDAHPTQPAERAWQVMLDRTGPTGAITDYPKYARGTVAIKGTMSDAASGPRDWQLQVKGPGQSSFANVCAPQTSPSGGKYSCQWNTAGLGEGTYELRAQMRDNVPDTRGGPNVSYTPVVTTLVDNTPPAPLQEIAPSVGSEDYSEELAQTDLTEVHWIQSDGSGSGVEKTTLLYNTATDGSASGEWLSAAAPPATGQGQTSTTWESSDMSDGMHLVRATSTDRAGNGSQTQFQVITSSDRRNCRGTPRPSITACYAGFAYGVPGARLPRDETVNPCDKYAGPSGDDTSGNGSPAAPYKTPVKLSQNLQPGQTGCLKAGVSVTPDNADSFIRTDGITIQSEPGTRAEWQGRIVLFGDNITLRNLKINPQNLRETGSCAWDPAPPCAEFGLTINGDGVRLINNDITSEGIPGTTNEAKKTHTNCVDVTGYKFDYARGPRNVEIRDNVIHKCGWPTAQDAESGGHWHGIYVSQADDAQIVNNVLYGNADRGIQLYPGPKRTIVRNNTLDDNGEGIDVANSTENSLIESNIVTNSREGHPASTWPSQAYYTSISGAIYNVYSINLSGTGNVAKNNCIWDKRSGHGGYDPDNDSDLRFIGNQAFDPFYADAAQHDFRPTSPPCLGAGATPPGMFVGYGVQANVRTPSFVPSGKGYHLGVGGSLYGSQHRTVDTGVNDGDPCADRKGQAPRKWTVYTRYSKPGGSTRASHCYEALATGATRFYQVAIRRRSGEYETIAVASDSSGRKRARVIVGHKKNVHIGSRGLLVSAFGETNRTTGDIGGRWSSVKFQKTLGGTPISPSADGSDWFDLTSHELGFGYEGGPGTFCVFGPPAAPHGGDC